MSKHHGASKVEKVLRALKRNWLKIAVVVAILVLGIVAIPEIRSNAKPTSAYSFSEACESDLGSEWDYTGYVDVPGSDHYHVKCEKDTGWFSSETQWVTVPKAGANTTETTE